MRKIPDGRTEGVCGNQFRWREGWFMVRSQLLKQSQTSAV